MKQQPSSPLLAASHAGREFKLTGEAVQFMEAAPGADGAVQLKRATMVAYTGGAMNVGWGRPVVVDLAGLRFSAKGMPILFAHDQRQVVGHATAIQVRDHIAIDWVVSGTGAAAKEVVANSANGFVWQASVGVWPENVEEVKAGSTAQVNGRAVNGPAYVIRKGHLRESSVVALGADSETSASIAARLNNGEIDMNFEQWLKAKGFEPETLNDTQRSALKAAFDAEQAAPSGAPANPPVAADADPAGDAVARVRAQVAAEQERIALVTAKAGGNAELAARAVREGWTADKTELEALRASRPAAPGVGSGRPQPTAQVVEAGLCLSAGVAEARVLKAYGEEVTNLAGAFSRMGLRDLFRVCAQMEGKDIPAVFGDGSAVIQAGFSTISLPGIFENAMGKIMLQAYEQQESVALQICRIGSVSDFKQVSRLRLMADGFKKVGDGGELKSMNLAEQKYTAQADTYGASITLTRKDVLNDDLGALADISKHIGIAAANAIENEFFTLLLANTGNFFHANNSNYVSGAGTAFGYQALSDLKALFRKQKAGPANAKRSINIQPKILLGPVEIETDMETLIASAQVTVDGSSSKTVVATDNVHRNKYKVLSAPQLSDTTFTGNSAKAWYLFADPNIVAAFEAVFLNGNRNPVISRSAPPAGTLGVAWEAYIDFGIAQQDPRGAAMAKGEA